MKRPTWILISIISCLVILSGCGSQSTMSDIGQEQQVSFENEIDGDTIIGGSDKETSMVVDDTVIGEEPQQQEPTKDVQLVDPYNELVDLSDRMASGHMRIDDLGELCDYINEQVSVGNLEMSFEYSPGAEGLDPTQLAWISSKMSISYYEDAENPNVLHMTVYLYPGDEIANAYLTGDTSALNTDEMQVLDIATEVVEEAKATASSELELEKILHDWVCERITYYDEADNRDVGDVNNPTRFLTAVGGVLDGRANCQGYTDTFYMLATMAGFRVHRLSAYTETDTHMFNIIFINGGWYVLDTTFDDRRFEDGTEKTVYMSFNASIDRRGELMWEEELQYLPIKEESDENFYYKASSELTGVQYPIWQDSIDEAAQCAVDQWLNNDLMTVQVFVPDANDSTGDVFFDKLQFYLEDTGLPYNYEGSTFGNGPDALYEVRFK